MQERCCLGRENGDRMERLGRVGTWRDARAKSAARDPSFDEGVARETEQINSEIAAYEAALADIRKARRLTQATLAEAMGTSQGEISELERRSDLYLSTLARYIEAMGGELELVAHFGDERVTLLIGDQ